MPTNTVYRARRPRQRCEEVASFSKQWPCLLPQHGPGRKHLREIALVPWQSTILDVFPEQFLRGLIHSDGWRGLNRINRGRWGWYAYPRYQFCNHSLDIQRIFCEYCDKLGIAWRQMNRWNISVARREAVARMDEFIGLKR